MVVSPCTQECKESNAASIYLSLFFSLQVSPVNLFLLNTQRGISLQLIFCKLITYWAHDGFRNLVDPLCCSLYCELKLIQYFVWIRSGSFLVHRLISHRGLHHASTAGRLLKKVVLMLFSGQSNNKSVNISCPFELQLLNFPLVIIIQS